jgi:molybdopterin-guanine dinucleotide biosynthesis protein A
MTITGIILAGGLGLRMGGLEKGLVNFRGQPMVVHIAQRLSSQVDEILINANREIGQYEARGYPVIPDDIPDFAGPLAGLHTGMRIASSTHILTVPCDSPLLPMDLAERLMSSLIGNETDLAVAKTGTQIHPVFCLCRKSLLPNLEDYLSNGGRKVSIWHSMLNVSEVAFDDNPGAFANINTPEELYELEKAL